MVYLFLSFRMGFYCGSVQILCALVLLPALCSCRFFSCSSGGLGFDGGVCVVCRRVVSERWRCRRHASSGRRWCGVWDAVVVGTCWKVCGSGLSFCLLATSSDPRPRRSGVRPWPFVLPGWFGSPLWRTSFAALFKALVPWCLSCLRRPPIFTTSAAAEPDIRWRFRRMQRSQRTCY
jgi:hypothetical protein